MHINNVLTQRPIEFEHLIIDVANAWFSVYNKRLPDNVNLSMMTSSAISVLNAYDLRHGSELTKTLYTYLKNNMGATESARELYIHRSSFLSRLERITSLTGLDLTSYETRLYLELSFAMLEMVRPPAQE